MRVFMNLATTPMVKDNAGVPITVTFSSEKCQNAYIVTYPVLAFRYDIVSGTRGLVTQIQWDKSDPECPDIEYTLTYQSGESLDPQVFSLSSDLSLYVQTSDPSKVRDYTIRVHGQMGFFSEEISFVVTVTNVCPQATIIPTIEISQIQVDITEP